MFPYDLPGPEFLSIYGVMFALSLFTAYGTSVMLSEQTGDAPKTVPQLDEYETAILAGGRKNAFCTAIAALVHAGAASIDTMGGKLYRHQTSAKLHPVEHAVHTNASSTGTRLDSIERYVKTNLDSIEQRLQRYGLLVSDLQLEKVRWYPAMIIGAPLILFAIPKIFIGIERGRPIGFLFALALLQLFAICVCAVQKTRPTLAGRRVVEDAKQVHAALSMNYRVCPKSLNQRDLALGAALFGAAAVMSDPYVQARTAMMRSTSSSGTGSSSSSCGSGSSCGGGGCGGGCGGCGG